MPLWTRGCDGQLALIDKLHNVGVVGVCWVDRHEARHAVDVAADADRRSKRAIYILSVTVHGQSSALATIWKK